VSDKLKLAEAYYTVARDMEAKARDWLYQSELLSKIADDLCEQSMREASPPLTSSEQQP
jgi:hypothetical protein